jgi:hypothetical protein
MKAWFDGPERDARLDVMNARKELARFDPQCKTALSNYVDELRAYEQNSGDPGISNLRFAAMDAANALENKLGINNLPGAYNNNMIGLEAFSNWYQERESNPHTQDGYQILSLARLPFRHPGPILLRYSILR